MSIIIADVLITDKQQIPEVGAIAKGRCARAASGHSVMKLSPPR